MTEGRDQSEISFKPLPELTKHRLIMINRKNAVFLFVWSIVHRSTNRETMVTESAVVTAAGN